MSETNSFLNYRLQSGKHQSRSLVACILQDFLDWQKYYDQLPKNCRNKNQLHLALEYLLPKIKALSPTKLCPFCGRRPIHFFALKDCGGFFNPPMANWVCCADKNCVHSLEYFSGVRLRVLSFEAFNIRSRFGNKKPVDPIALQQLLVMAYELPDLISDALAIDYLQKRFQRHHRKSA